MKLTAHKHATFTLCVILLSLSGAQAAKLPSLFDSVTPHVRIYHDVVNVGIIERNGKALLIDSGEGSVLHALKKAEITRIEWVLYTHHHRDQCSGAERLKKAGVKIAVPAAEAKVFRDASGFWLDADTLIDHRYDFRPDLLVLRSSVLPDRELHPDEVFRWEGCDIRIVSTPGHTDGSVTYIVAIDGKQIAFTGDLIYGPGQIWEFYSLQKGFPGMTGGKDFGRGGYWGFGGAVRDLEKSLDTVLSYKPNILVPSHGAVMRDPPAAVSEVKQNLDGVMTNYLKLAAWRIYFGKQVNPGYDVPMLSPLPVPQLPAWIHRMIQTSWYLRADDGSIFLLDCGFAPILDEIDQLVRSGSIKSIDGIWISHYHDDHVQSVNDIRRRYGAKVFAQRELQDILENPRAYSMPCLFPESIRVDHTLSEGEVIDWKGYKLTGFYFPGQTIYHDGLLIEHDGTRVFMSGDSIANFGIDDYCSYNRNFLGHEPGYQQCFRLLLQLKPDVLVAAHFGAIPFSSANLQEASRILEEREALFSKLLPWDNVNFGLDPSWVRAYPYRQTVLKGQTVALEAKIWNHSDSPREASIDLQVPAGWKVTKTGRAVIPPHTEGTISLGAIAPANPQGRRDVLGLDIRFGGRDLGEITEAIIDYLQ